MHKMLSLPSRRCGVKGSNHPTCDDTDQVSLGAPESIEGGRLYAFDWRQEMVYISGLPNVLYRKHNPAQAQLVQRQEAASQRERYNDQ